MSGSRPHAPTRCPAYRTPRYRHLKAILDSRLDCEAERRPKRPAPAGEGGHLRGADYYRD